jgi:iron complex outermembrane receptor protein
MDRDDGNTSNASIGHGFALGADGFIYLAADAKYQESSDRSRDIADSVQLYYANDGIADPRETTADRHVTRNYGQPKQKGVNLSYNAELGLGDALRIYSFTTYSMRQSDLMWSFRAPNSINALNGPDVEYELYPDGFRPVLRIDEIDYEYTVGLKGMWGDWDWDLSTTYGRNHSRRRGHNTLNASLGPSSPTEFYLGRLTSDDWVTSLDLTRSVTLVHRPLQVSWGLQHRYEMYRIGAGEYLAYAAGDWVYPEGHERAGSAPAPGAQGAITFLPSEAGSLERNSGSVYVDFTLDVSERLSLGAAARYERFSDSSGDTANGKFTARYSLTSSLALRGSASTGFRAPALAQSLYAATNSSWRTLSSGERELYYAKTLPVDSAAAKALGAKPLKPEESVNFSAGFVYSPTRNFSLTLDAYQIELDDRITMTGTLSGDEVTAILNDAGISSEVESAQFFTNAIDTRTRGVDLVGTLRSDFGDFGCISFNLGFNYNETDITRIADNPDELESLGNYQLFSREAQGYLTRTPKTKLTLGANWTLNAITVNLRLNRFGSFDVLADNPENDEHAVSRWITDLEFGYGFSRRWTWVIGANNLFNIYPNDIGVTASTGSGQYVTSVPYGFTGGSYYTKLSYRF